MGVKESGQAVKAGKQKKCRNTDACSMCSKKCNERIMV